MPAPSPGSWLRRFPLTAYFAIAYLVTWTLLMPLALSALLYGFGYLVFSVAAETRYHLWTMIAALLATVLVAGDLFAEDGISRRRAALAVAPAVIVALLCAAARIA